jgi:competence ComEA-like helix-hairpin-helix protein
MKRLVAICLAAMLSSSACSTRAVVIEQPAGNNEASKQDCVNLNTASPQDLEQLQGVGTVLARRIVEYRERHKGFRRPEELIIVEGFSEKKYLAIKKKKKICVD